MGVGPAEVAGDGAVVGNAICDDGDDEPEVVGAGVRAAVGRIAGADGDVVGAPVGWTDTQRPSHAIRIRA